LLQQPEIKEVDNWT